MNKLAKRSLSLRSRRIIISICGIIVNVIFSYIMYRLGLPLFLDTVGTIAVVTITGALFPAICTAVVTSVLCSLFYWPAMYFSSFNAVIIVITLFFLRRDSFKQIGKLFIYVPLVALVSSLSVSIIQYCLNGLDDASLIAKNALAFSSAASVPYLLSFCITNFMLYFLEKGVICIVALLLLIFIPKKYFADQNGLFNTAKQYLAENYRKMKNPLHTKIVLTFVIASMILVFLTEAIALRSGFS